MIDSIDSAGILLYQTYSVLIRDLKKGTQVVYLLSVAPPNQGPKATPNYEEKQGRTSVFELANGMRVFAGPRDDAFYFESAAVFDFLNFRAPAPVLAGAADQGQGGAYPGAQDGFAGYNISLIAVEAPISLLTADGTVPTDPRSPNAKIAGWTSSWRQVVTVRPSPADPMHFGEYVMVDRVGNPLPMKDQWNRSEPANDMQFAPFIRDPVFVSAVLKGVFGLNTAPAPRNDLLGIFVPDITRIDLTIPPVAPGAAGYSRLGALGGDNGGWPFGGRRIGDDVVGIGLRAAAGVLATGFGGAPNNQLGDGVNSNDLPYLDRFPFHAPPHAGFLHSGQEGTNGRGTPTQ